ncbi:MAG: SpoIIE family protein phosphatase [Oscillospiraceae bacterium]|jgi:sigma-B regulation protein RsbU (phosphoserine phosphatase)|nr:SpoIIE family protein phosphatase [Oscillospiraceae bacterium]
MKPKKVFKLTSKLIILFSAFSLIIVISVAALTCKKYYDNILESYGQKAKSAASAVAYIIDADKVEKYRDSLIIDEEYRKIVRDLDQINKRLDLLYLYVMCPLNENETMFIYDASEIGDGIEDTETERKLLGDIVEYGESFNLAKLAMAGSKNTYLLDIVHSKLYGFVASSYAAFKNSSNKTVGYVGVDINMNLVMNELFNYIITSLSIIIAIIIICVIILMMIVKKIIIKPIDEISRVSENFVNEDYENINVEFIKVKGKDEIGKLAQSFNKMMSDIKDYTENVKKITSEKQQAASELSVANRIQKSMLPRIFPAFPELDEMDIYAVMIPARQVGGDFYDFFLIDKTHLAFVVADVSGKGVSAALFMVIAKTLIKNQAHVDLDPSVVFEKVNNQMCDNNDMGMFLTAFLGILNLETGEIMFSNAGHTMPAIKKSGDEFKFLKVKEHFVIAGMPNLNYNCERTNLEPGDAIFLYTDGVTETTNEKKEFWGEDNLLKILNSIDVEKTPLKDTVDTIKKKIDSFAGKTPQSDDITMLVIKYNGKRKK